MRVTLVIVICIVIFGVLVDANINSRVHAEYIRRRQAPDQHYDKILQEILVRKYRRHHTPRVRQHIRQQQRSGGNINI